MKRTWRVVLLVLMFVLFALVAQDSGSTSSRPPEAIRPAPSASPAPVREPILNIDAPPSFRSIVVNDGIKRL